MSDGVLRPSSLSPQPLSPVSVDRRHAARKALFMYHVSTKRWPGCHIFQISAGPSSSLWRNMGRLYTHWRWVVSGKLQWAVLTNGTWVRSVHHRCGGGGRFGPWTVPSVEVTHHALGLNRASPPCSSRCSTPVSWSPSSTTSGLYPMVTAVWYPVAIERYAHARWWFDDSDPWRTCFELMDHLS